MKRRPLHKESRGVGAAGGLAFTSLGDVRILGKLGEGGRSTVYHGDWHGREIALKVYKPQAIERHARKHRVNLAEYEYLRNKAFYEARGLARYVAEPFGYLATGGIYAFMQERLDGELYYFYFRERGGIVPVELAGHLTRIVELSHGVGLYDVDLHPMNVMVVQEPAGAIVPRLFDFNLIPFHVHPPNKLVAFLLKTRLMSLRARDLRKLRNFHDFSRVEAKLLKFYE